MNDLARIYLVLVLKSIKEDASFNDNLMTCSGFGVVYKAPGDNCMFQPPHFDIAHPIGVSILVPIWKTQNGTMIYKNHPKVERLKKLSHVWMVDTNTTKIVSYNLYYLF